MAKVSIIIPTYNVEMYLEQCMESVVNQTLQDIEIICINDGSTDSSLDILKKYAANDNRIILVDKINEGYGIGMNIGLDKASGEYIGIVEPDDFVPLNMYEDLYNKAINDNLDFVKADFFRFTVEEDGTYRRVYNQLSKNPADYNVVFDPSYKPETLKFIMNTWSGIYKRDFLEKYHIRHNTTPGASFQDNGFFFQTFAYANRAMIIDTPYYMNRRDNPNSSVKNREKVYCMNVEYDYIRDLMMKDSELWDRFKAMYWVKRWGNYVGTLKRIAEEFKVEYVSAIAKEIKKGIADEEFDFSVFPEGSQKKINILLTDEEAFYQEYVLSTKERMKKAEKEVKRLSSSNSYKIGRVVTAIPRGIKKIVK